MRVLVTGAAGFVGSHVVAGLVSRGHDVWGIDAFRSPDVRQRKRRNLELAHASGEWLFEHREVGSLTASEMQGVDTVIHIAGQADLRASWDDFDGQLFDNLGETNRLARIVGEARIPRLIFASSSAVYGEALEYPVRETASPHPRSPYGVTKLAGESLLEAHAAASHFDVVALRLFTVYGPGQRDDMAIAQLIDAALNGGAFTQFGDGTTVRDFTFVADVVAAFIASVERPVPPGLTCLNIGSVDEISLRDLVKLVETVTGNPIDVRVRPAQRGDVTRTCADAREARRVLEWAPRVSLAEGIAWQVAFARDPSAMTWAARAPLT